MNGTKRKLAQNTPQNW